jgi:predicted acetyltransferase
MSTDPAYGCPSDEAELRRLAEIIGRSFGHPADRTYDRFPIVGQENLRVYRERERVDAGLWFVPMGQWFGGRSVPMTGVGAVGVMPEARGRGLALRVMTEALQELHEARVPLSTLYPAAQALYRKVGYEQAGCRFQATLSPDRIAVRERSVAVREATMEDRPAIEKTYAAHARTLDGHLDRGSFIWDRVYSWRDQEATGYLIEEEGRLTGYAYLLARPQEAGGFDLQLTDLVAVTAAAGLKLWSLLAAHRSMSREISWFSGPNHPLLLLLPEQSYRIKLQLAWMMRIVDVIGALEARGYPSEVQTELHLEVEDDLLEGNRDRFVLEVAGGRGHARCGGSGALKVDIRALSALYSGFYTPWTLAVAGGVEGDTRDLGRAAGVFGGATPWMPDMF